MAGQFKYKVGQRLWYEPQWYAQYTFASGMNSGEWTRVMDRGINSLGKVYKVKIHGGRVTAWIEEENFAPNKPTFL